MRTFTGYRHDVPEHYVKGGYGNAGDQPQYQGVVFEDGTVAVRWLTQYRSTSLWPSFVEFNAVHGHSDYDTEIRWHDEGGEPIWTDKERVAKDEEPPVNLFPPHLETALEWVKKFNDAFLGRTK